MNKWLLSLFIRITPRVIFLTRAAFNDKLLNRMAVDLHEMGFVERAVA